MKSLSEVVNGKFEEALHMAMSGHNSLFADSPVVGADFEIIALDSDEPPNSRCILSRNCIGAMPVKLHGVDIVCWGVEIPREDGDMRRLEELSQDEVKGFLFNIGMKEDDSIVIEGAVHPDWLSVGGLTYALSGMRVAESNPLIF